MKHGNAAPDAQRRRLAELHRLLAQWSRRGLYGLEPAKLKLEGTPVSDPYYGEEDDMAELQAAINKACGR